MIWLLVILALRWLGFPWFAALACAILSALFWSGLDSLVLMLEFARLAEFEALLALPFLFLCARLLASQANAAGARRTASAPRGLLRVASGEWLTSPDQTRPIEPAPSVPLPALLLAPSGGLLLVAIVMEAVDPARTPDFRALLLAGLLPGMLAIPFALRWSGRQNQTPMQSRSIRWRLLVAAGLLGGLYLGRWGIVEAGALAAFALTAEGLLFGRLSRAQLTRHIAGSLRDFGMLALLFGLALAWAAVVFDGGLERNWLAAIGSGLSASYFRDLLLGGWVLSLWTLAAWLMRPMPALVIAAPFIVPAALGAGLAAEPLALLSLLALYAGNRLGRRQICRTEGLSLLLAAAVIVLWPELVQWLPAQAAGAA